MRKIALGRGGDDDMKWPDEQSWPTPTEIEEERKKAKALQAEKEAIWEYWHGLDSVWLDYTTHNGVPRDFNWECKNCGSRNDEGADVNNSYYIILECDVCGTDYRVIDPR